MKTLTLIRTLYSEKATFGVLIDENYNFVCHMLELPWLENEKNVSCIPVGKYHCEIMPNSGGFKYAVHNVPGRTLIRIHVANEPNELLGCLAPGIMFVGSTPNYQYIAKSKIALTEIYERAGNNFMLCIKDFMKEEILDSIPEAAPKFAKNVEKDCEADKPPSTQEVAQIVNQIVWNLRNMEALTELCTILGYVAACRDHLLSKKDDK